MRQYGIWPVERQKLRGWENAQAHGCMRDRGAVRRVAGRLLGKYGRAGGFLHFVWRCFYLIGADGRIRQRILEDDEGRAIVEIFPGHIWRHRPHQGFLCAKEAGSRHSAEHGCAGIVLLRGPCYRSTLWCGGQSANGVCELDQAADISGISGPGACGNAFHG